MATIATPEAAHTTAPSTPPPRITKNDRVALVAIHIAAALPGNWTVGRGRDEWEVADLLCLSSGIRIGLHPWDERAWGYYLVPDVPPRFHGAFRWPTHEFEEGFHPGFAVGAAPAEVATYIHEQLVPQLDQGLARAVAAEREREQKRAACEEVAVQLRRDLTAALGSEGQLVRVTYLPRITCPPSRDEMTIVLTMPVDEAIGRAPALGRALSAPIDDTAKPPAREGIPAKEGH
ncbi:hypothetical protein AB0383_16570 [Amycolatopsis sp. NPDC051373]|uniref:hypothetical protein n=1 Tax=Amycolatopsis sp. NPDC051373 TaxID=3155801 RepID=UPI00344E6D5B